jgi:hypothetical protein
MTQPTEVRQATREEALWLTGQIRTATENLRQLITAAYLSQAWIPLEGCSSWDSYAKTYLGDCWLRIPLESRPAEVRSLHDAGLSLRAIAAVTTQSKSELQRQLAGVPDPPSDGTPPLQPVTDQKQPVVGIDGKVYAPRPAASYPPEPPKEWVLRITAQAKEAGCRVHWKPNLEKSVWYDEYPRTRNIVHS